MGLKTSVAKNIFKRVLAGSLGFAIVHSIVFWTAWYKVGHSSRMLDVNALVRGAKALGNQSIWLDIYKWTGFPMSEIGASSHGGFVVLMIVNALLWGLVAALIVGFIARKMR